MNTTDIDTIAKTMQTSFAERDAFICNAIKKLTPLQAETLHNAPRSPKSSRLMQSILEYGMTNPSMKGNRRIIRISNEMADAGLRLALDQPYAVAAYLAWIVQHDDDAIRYAESALSIDRENTLALIVKTAIARGYNR